MAAHVVAYDDFHTRFVRLHAQVWIESDGGVYFTDRHSTPVGNMLHVLRRNETVLFLDGFQFREEAVGFVLGDQTKWRRARCVRHAASLALNVYQRFTPE